jgi:hypothetical protein
VATIKLDASIWGVILSPSVVAPRVCESPYIGTRLIHLSGLNILTVWNRTITGLRPEGGSNLDVIEVTISIDAGGIATITGSCEARGVTEHVLLVDRTRLSADEVLERKHDANLCAFQSMIELLSTHVHFHGNCNCALDRPVVKVIPSTLVNFRFW